MSNEVKVNYGDNAAGTASRLLAAASALDLDAAVVKTTSDNVFLVPEEVADEAGLSYTLEGGDETSEPEAAPSEPEAAPSGEVVEHDAIEVPAGTLEERIAWVAEGEDESERTKRANAVWGGETDMSEDDGAQLSTDLTRAVHGSTPDEDDKKAAVQDPEPEPVELPIGKALEKALKDAGLPTSGNKADKQARLSEHLSKE